MPPRGVALPVLAVLPMLATALHQKLEAVEQAESHQGSNNKLHQFVHSWNHLLENQTVPHRGQVRLASVSLGSLLAQRRRPMAPQRVVIQMGCSGPGGGSGVTLLPR